MRRCSSFWSPMMRAGFGCCAATILPFTASRWGRRRWPMRYGAARDPRAGTKPQPCTVPGSARLCALSETDPPGRAASDRGSPFADRAGWRVAEPADDNFSNETAAEDPERPEDHREIAWLA